MLFTQFLPAFFAPAGFLGIAILNGYTQIWVYSSGILEIGTGLEETIFMSHTQFFKKVYSISFNIPEIYT